MPAQLTHLTIVVDDLAAADAFYGVALPALGLQRLVELVDEEESDAPVEVVGWAADGAPEIWIAAGEPVSSGLHLVYLLKSQLEVDTFYQACVAHGGVSMRSPRRWALYRTGHYSAVVADRWGNRLEVTAAED